MMSRSRGKISSVLFFAVLFTSPQGHSADVVGEAEEWSEPVIETELKVTSYDEQSANVVDRENQKRVFSRQVFGKKISTGRFETYSIPLNDWIKSDASLKAKSKAKSNASAEGAQKGSPDEKLGN